ncbi:MAG: nucleotide exchange factor GrpE [Candidatus ainarchaeum sp.]|nr:nucleotide exchange factor GrpE [Candidatus ainarchaeum sp.]
MENSPAAESRRHSEEKPKEAKKEPETNAKITGSTGEIQKKEAEIKELRETLQRLQADFENYCKRIDRQKKEFVEFANTETIRELLPLLDSFQAAIEKLRDMEIVSKKEALEGIGALEKHLFAIMQKHGLQEIGTREKKFDPLLHEAVLHENNPEKKDNEILEELQKGFLLKGKLLRPAKVKINRAEKK